MTCGECGGDFELSARNVRLHRQRGTTPRCRRCRYGHKPPQPTPALRDYWTSRYSLDEIRELAGGIWPDVRRDV